MAKALAIDENRYTRYERAEVEPDIELIYRICETLRLSPNDLFGADDDAHVWKERSAAAPAGFAEPGLAPTGLPDSDTAFRRGRTGWRLACAVVELQRRGGDNGSGDLPLATLQRAARLFADLERRPFSAISEILLRPAVVGAPAEEAKQIGRLIEDLTASAM